MILKEFLIKGGGTPVVYSYGTNLKYKNEKKRDDWSHCLVEKRAENYGYICILQFNPKHEFCSKLRWVCHLNQNSQTDSEQIDPGKGQMTG